MTLTLDKVSIEHVGNGTVGPYSYDFNIPTEAEATVTRKVIATGVTTTLILNVDYTISGTGNPAGGAVTLMSLLAPTHSIKIKRNVNFTQALDIQNQGGFIPNVLEAQLDRVVMQTQQLKDEIGDAAAAEAAAALYAAEAALSRTEASTAAAEATEALVATIGKSKAPARVVSVSDGVLATAFAAGQVVDGVALVLGDSILLVGQTNQVENGIYVVTAGAPTRRSDADTGPKLINCNLLILAGSLYGGSKWNCSNQTPPDVGTDPITWVQTGTAGGVLGTSASLNSSVDKSLGLLTPSSIILPTQSAVRAAVDEALYNNNNSPMRAGFSIHDKIITMTIASPAVVTWKRHGLAAGDPVIFQSTGALPTGVARGKVYFVIATDLTANTFKFSDTIGGAAVNTSGTQSGVHNAIMAQTLGNMTNPDFAMNGTTSASAANSANRSSATEAFFGLHVPKRPIAWETLTVYGASNHGYVVMADPLINVTVTIQVFGKDAPTLDTTGDLLGSTTFIDSTNSSDPKTFSLLFKRRYNYLMVRITHDNTPRNIVLAAIVATERRQFGIGRTAADRASDSISAAEWGVKADGIDLASDFTNINGTDNSVALQNAIDECAEAGFGRLNFPAGLICHNSQLTWRQQRAYVGSEFDTPQVGNSIKFDSGSVLVFRGTGIAHISPTNGAFARGVFKQLSFVSLRGANSRWIMRLTTPRSCIFDQTFMWNAANTLVDGVNGPGCLNTDDAAGAFGPSWANTLRSCSFMTDHNRNVNYPGEDVYEGYGFGLHTDANDWEIHGCSFKNSTLFVQDAGLGVVTTTNFENVGKGQLAPGETSSRALIVFKAEDEQGKRTMSGKFSACYFSQGGVAFIFDGRATADFCNVNIEASNFRRNWEYDFWFRGNETTGTHGGPGISNCSFIVDALARGYGEPRIRRSGIWMGERFANNGRYFSDSPTRERALVAARWRPRLGANTMSEEGVASVGQGKVARTLDSGLMGALSRIGLVTTNVANNVAEVHGETEVCVRGGETGRGGFLARFQFSFVVLGVDTRCLLGLHASTSKIDYAANVPHNLTNLLGVGISSKAGATDTMFSIYRAGGSPTTRLRLRNFVPTQGHLYELLVGCAPNVNVVGTKFTNMTSGESVLIETPNSGAPELDFDAQSAAFVPGELVTGADSLATAMIGGQVSDGTVGTLFVYDTIGRFVDNEIITGGGGGSARVNEPAGFGPTGGSPSKQFIIDSASFGGGRPNATTKLNLHAWITNGTAAEVVAMDLHLAEVLVGSGLINSRTN